MAKKAIPSKNPLEGRWRITSMEQWDQDYVDEEEKGYFEFGPHNSGSFHFGYVQGIMDCRATLRDGIPRIDFTWEGNDESDEAQGRGWVVLDGTELKGEIFFHEGDDSEFRATKQNLKGA